MQSECFRRNISNAVVVNYIVKVYMSYSYSYITIMDGNRDFTID